MIFDRLIEGIEFVSMQVLSIVTKIRSLWILRLYEFYRSYIFFRVCSRVWPSHIRSGVPYLGRVNINPKKYGQVMETHLVDVFCAVWGEREAMEWVMQ